MQDFGLLLLRAGAGFLMMGHGFGKAMDLIGGRHDFPDPIGVGPLPSLALAAFAEFVCAILVVVGLKTRWAAVPIVVTMLVAALVFHASDGWERQEFPILYAVAFLTLLFTGAGRFSVDGVLARRKKG